MAQEGLQVAAAQEDLPAVAVAHLVRETGSRADHLYLLVEVVAAGQLSQGGAHARGLDLRSGVRVRAIYQFGELTERRVVAREAEAALLQVERAVVVPRGCLNRVVV